MKKSFFRLLSVLALLLLLFWPALAFAGAKAGLTLWGGVVVPTLLPFMICSNVIVALNAIHLLIFPVKGILRRFFRLSDPGSYVFVSGLLCGYPMGARNCSDFLDESRISEREGKYLLAVCNHPSPMFLLGYAGAALPPGVPLWQLMAAVYLPVFPLAWAARKYYGITEAAVSRPVPEKSLKSFDDSLMDSCEIMVKIGGYIMLFSILALYITSFPVNASGTKAILLGFVEITTGIKAVSSEFSGTACGMWIGISAAFGGLSGIFQTKSVIKNAGLSIRHYMGWKALHSLLTAVFFILLSQCLHLPVPV